MNIMVMKEQGATEISFVTLDENTTNQSLTDRARGSKNKVTIYIKYADVNANDIGIYDADESADTLSDNKLYYKTAKGKENYLAQIARRSW